MAKNVAGRVKRPDNSLAAQRSRAFVILAALAVGIVVCYLLAVPFLPALTWALVLAIMFYPLRRRISTKLRYRDFAAAGAVAIAVFVIAVPLILLAERLVDQAASGAQIAAEALQSGGWRETLANYPSLAPALLWIEAQLDLAGLADTIATVLANISASFVRGSVTQIVNAILTFYFLYYFLRDGSDALIALKNFSPLTSEEMDKLFGRVKDTVYAIVYGTFAVAAVQGTLGGLMFWLLGLPSPLLWGIAMGLLAVVPMFGAFIIWIPAALSFALSGEWGKAVALTAWGAVVVGMVDNLLYPMLVGDRLKLHTLLAFMSMIGGIIVFGPAGVVIGPVTLSATLLLLEFWRAHIKAISNDPEPLEIGDASGLRRTLAPRSNAPGGEP